MTFDPWYFLVDCYILYIEMRFWYHSAVEQVNANDSFAATRSRWDVAERMYEGCIW